MGRCVVLVPVTDRIEPECERALADLAKRGYTIRRMAGHSAIDMARCMMATAALDEGFDELMWIDADIGFSADSVDRLRAHERPIACAVYPKKGQRELACHTLPGTREIVLGEGGGLMPLRYAATGFLYTRRDVYDGIRERLSLARCNTRFGKGIDPYFLPMVIDDPDADGKVHRWYLGEDYAFCERARQAGFEILADTTVRLWHIGRYGYTWEDAGNEPTRHKTYKLVLT